jgi:hypothetical protein
MKDEGSLELGEFRMLDVDNSVVVPIDTHIRFIITGADVIHDWAVPALGFKVDAAPGRLNQASVIIERAGFFYGQCSEICLWPDRFFSSGKALIFPSVEYSEYYDVNIHELFLLWLLLQPIFSFWTGKNGDAYINLLLYFNIIWQIMMIIVKLVLLEWPWYSEHCIKIIRIKNMFKQKNILVSELNKILWLTETKSIIIKSTKLSKLGNLVYIIIIYYVLKQLYLVNYNYLHGFLLFLFFYGKSWIKQLIHWVSRGQDWYQDNYNYNYNYINNYNLVNLNYHAYRFCNIYKLHNCNIRYYSTVIPLKLTKEIYNRLREDKWITKPQKLLLISYIKQKIIANNLIYFYNIYAIELLSITIKLNDKEKINILNMLQTFTSYPMYKINKLSLIYNKAIEQLLLLLLLSPCYNYINKYQFIEDLYIILKSHINSSVIIWYGNINCDNIYKYISYCKNKNIIVKYNKIINNIIYKTYNKWNHLLFIDYVLKDISKDLKKHCIIIRYNNEIVIISNNILSPIVINDYLKLRGLYIDNYKKVTKSINLLDYTIILGDKVYINSSIKNIKWEIKQILKSSYNLSNNELIDILKPKIIKWTSNCNNTRTLVVFRKFLTKRLRIYLIKKHKKVSIGKLMYRYTPLFCNWKESLLKIFQ